VLSERNIVFRAELPRLYELKDSVGDPASPDAYFCNFDQDLARSAHVKEIYLRYERDLQGLDGKAWEHLKAAALRRVTARDKKGRGWQQLFDILNEARAYSYLKSLGWTNLRFIPRSPTRTPDIEGSRASDRVLCEVKTINISNVEVAFRTGQVKVRSGQVALPAEFLEKLRNTVEKAKQQLLAFDPGRAAAHLVYLNVLFDDFLGELKEAYFRQIDDDLAGTPVMDVRLVICNDRTAFYKPLKMRFADVDNLD
jgi:hypothetical protein